VEGANGRVDGYTLYGGMKDKKGMFLCTAKKGNTYYPGRIENKNCLFVYKEEVMREKNYYTLKTSKEGVKRYFWEEAKEPGKIPTREGYVPIIVGKENGNLIHVCRVIFDKDYYSGTLKDNSCKIVRDDKLEIRNNYQILLFKTKR
jgi:hypothetical protein